MSKGTLVDLYVPASAGTLEELALTGRDAGLDALVYVGLGLDGLEEATDAISAGVPTDGLSLFPGCVLGGHTWRLLVLLPTERLPEARQALDGLDEPAAIAQAVSALGGCAIPVCPRHRDDGSCHQERCVPPHDTPVGWVTVTAGGSILGTDLALEDCFAADRMALAGTGPFGSLEDVGRLATHLPSPPADLATLIGDLVAGHGAAVHRLGAAERQDQPSSTPKKKSRRRRRRKQQTREGATPDVGSGGDAPSQAAS